MHSSKLNSTVQLFKTKEETKNDIISFDLFLPTKCTIASHK